MTAYLTIQECADLIKMSEATIRKAMKDGLPFVRVGRVRGIRIRVADLHEWLDRRIEVSTSSHEREIRELTRAARTLNQQVTAHDA